MKKGFCQKKEKVLKAGVFWKEAKKIKTFSMELHVYERMKNIFQLFFISTNFHFENVPSVNRFSYSVFIYDRTKSDIYCPYRLLLYEHFSVTF